jgi:hemerythrin-like domain-containing protein/uncharacterized membrane protein
MYSAYLVGNTALIRRIGATRFTGGAASISSIFVMGHFLAVHPWSALSISRDTYLTVLGLALISTVIPIWLTSEALRLTGPSRVAIISSIGPIATIILGAIFLGEPMTLASFAGAALVLAGVALVTHLGTCLKSHISGMSCPKMNNRCAFMSHPVEELYEDHRLIERMLSELEHRVLRTNVSPFPVRFIESALDFFRVFADSCHHHKEENVLFPELVNAGVPVDGGPIGVMMAEHETGRECLARIEENLPAAANESQEAISNIREAAAEYISMLRQHIWKEDNVLFQIAIARLSGKDQVKTLETGFLRENLAGSVRAKYVRLLEELSPTPVA